MPGNRATVDQRSTSQGRACWVEADSQRDLSGRRKVESAQNRNVVVLLL